MTSQREKDSFAREAATYRREDFNYDAWGRLTEVIHYDNGMSQTSASYVYDWADRVKQQRTGIDSTVHFEYDHMGNVIEKTDALGQKEYFNYDNAGRLITSTDRNGTAHSITYDVLSRPLTEKA